MPAERPFGILIIAAVLTFWGGVGSFILAIDIIDSIRFYGFASLMINSVPALGGFVLYAALPILTYMTGMGVFEARRWAYKAVRYWLPLIMLMFLLNFGYNKIRIDTAQYHLSFLKIFFYHFDQFIAMLTAYAVTVLAIFYYMRIFTVRGYFTE